MVPASDGDRPWSRVAWIPLAAVAAALLVRLPLVVGAGFPLNDGGMIATIIDDIRAAGGALPAFTSYNGGGIPLCYPPLAFYLAVATTLPTIEALRWLPLLVSCLTPAAVALLALQLLRSRSSALAAGLWAAFVPIVYAWDLVGGGMTRGVGLLLTVLAVTAVLRMAASPTTGRAVAAGLLMGAAVLAHPESALMTAVLGVLALLLSRGWRAALPKAIMSAGVAAAVVLPWLITVLVRHGLTPWESALSVGGSADGLTMALRRVLAWNLTGELGLPLLAVVALLGAPAALVRRQWLALAWTLLPFYLAPRNCRFWASPGAAVLAGLAVGVLLVPALQRASQRRSWATASVALLAVILLGHGFAEGRAAAARVALLRPIPEQDRALLRWLALHAGPNDAIVATELIRWGGDGVSEWAPYLTRRVNVIAPEGQEWVPGGWGRASRRRETLQASLVGGGGELGRWMESHPEVRWLMLGTRATADRRVSATVAAAEAEGVLRLARWDSGAAVYSVSTR